MHDDIGLNFAMALRAFLRQDPDIIMVGEIRDFETAEIAVKAALTGHLVLSTLHTNDAPATISRLLNMGVEPFLITASASTSSSPSASRARSARTASSRSTSTPKVLDDVGFTDEQIATREAHEGRAAARPATTPATRAASRSTRSCASPTRSRSWCSRARRRPSSRPAAIKNGMSTLRMSGIEKVLRRRDHDRRGQPRHDGRLSA